MNNLPDDNQHLVRFLRQHQPTPPPAQLSLEQTIIDSLGESIGESTLASERRRYFRVTWTIPGAIATGFLFTSVSFGWKTPRIAVEPKDLENFMVKNWQDSLKAVDSTTIESADTYWLLPTAAETKSVETEPALSISNY